jgi:hypothetical protein
MITPLKVEETKRLLGDSFISTFQSEMNSIIDPLRKYLKRGFPLSMGKELWEYVVADSIQNATWNGAGNSVADVLLSNGHGIDVKTVGRSGNSKISGEASMLQSFDQENKKHFREQNGQALWENYVGGWYKKVSAFEKYYLIGIIRQKETLDCTLIMFEVTNSPPIFSEDKFDFLNKSGKLYDLVDPNFAKIRYTNSKSRIEIQFKEPSWTDPEYCLPIFRG